MGFSHGVLFKVLDVNTEENFRIIAASGAKAIEINCHSSKDSEQLNSLLPYIKDFERISLHAPCDIFYEDNEETLLLLKNLEDFYQKSGAELIVIHPNKVNNWSVFGNFKMNWMIENLDDRAEKYKSLDDLKEFFGLHPKWGLVLDLGHCNSNDKSMILARDLIKEFKDKISEIHLSGYETFHDPLHRTKQTEIINYCQNLSAPIIIESVFEPSDGIEGIKKEFDYVLENVKIILNK